MNYRAEYNREWTNEEDVELNGLYNEDMLGIMEIHERMNIMPWFITKRLIEKKYIEREEISRGYGEYYKSPLRRESPEYLKMMEKMRGLLGGTAYSN